MFLKEDNSLRVENQYAVIETKDKEERETLIISLPGKCTVFFFLCEHQRPRLGMCISIAWSGPILTVKVPSKILADSLFFFFFLFCFWLFFRENEAYHFMGIICLIFSENIKKYFKILSAAVVIGALKDFWDNEN